MTVTTRIYAPEPSAASLRLSALVDELLSREVEVTVLTTTPGPRGSVELEKERGSIRRVPALRDTSGYVRGYVPYLSFDIPLFFRVLFGRRSDLLVCEPPPTSGAAVRLAAALRRTPYAYYAADIWSDAAAATGAPAIVLRVVRAVERFAMRGASLVLAVTDGVRSRVHDLAPRAAIEVVGHGVDLSIFSSVDSPRPEMPADIVYVGTASEWHGAELAVEAIVAVLEEQPALTAAFVGQGTSWERMRETVAQRGLKNRVSFHAPVPAEQAAGWLRTARISLATLAPGQGYDFAVPTKLYASLAAGTRVVFAGPEPVRSLINDNDLGTGTAYDVGALANAISAELRRTPGGHDEAVAEWAAQHVSASAVAARASDALLRRV